MKRFIVTMILITILIVALFVTKAINGGGTDEPTTEATTEEVETTTEVEETTEVEVVETTTGRYEDPALFKKVELSPSDLPFKFGYADAVGKVYMYIPTGENGDADVWDNTYIVVEHQKEKPVSLKLDKADGINTGNIIPKKEMESANWTFFYFDGEYSQEYTMDRDGDMLIFKDFPEAKKIKMKNRSPMPIYVGEIAGESVSVNTIIVKIVE